MRDLLPALLNGTFNSRAPLVSFAAKCRARHKMGLVQSKDTYQLFMDDVETTRRSENKRLYVRFTLVIQAALVIGLVLFTLRRDWENVFLTVMVIGLTL